MKKTWFIPILTIVTTVAMTLIVAVAMHQSGSQLSDLAKANIDALADDSETNYGDANFYVIYPICAINVPAGSVVHQPGLPPYTAEFDMFIQLIRTSCMSGGQDKCRTTTCEEELRKQGITID